jgi:hypothetical protein
MRLPHGLLVSLIPTSVPIVTFTPADHASIQRRTGIAQTMMKMAITPTTRKNALRAANSFMM